MEDRLPPMCKQYHHAPPRSTVGGHNALHTAAADAHVVGNAALRPAIAAQPLGALLSGLSGPQDDDDRQE